MRKFALFLIALGVSIALLGGSLKLAAWKSQSDARSEWEGQDHEVGKPEPVTRLSFPAQGRQDFIVMDGASDENLLRGPARVAWSVVPGENGNCIIAAHRDTHFRILQEVREGQEIALQRSGQIYRYRIVALHVIPPSDTSFYQPTSTAVLTLVTCYPFSYFGNAPDRFIVRAELLDTSS
jgi:sortase A